MPGYCRVLDQNEEVGLNGPNGRISRAVSQSESVLARSEGLAGKPV